MKKMIYLALVLMLALPSFAHERQAFTVGKTDYLFVIGSMNEPVFVNDETGVELRIMRADPNDPYNSRAPNATPLNGLEKTLNVELLYGDERKTLPLEATYNTPGSYESHYYPTAAVALSYRVFGTINDAPFNATFTCNEHGHHMQSADDKTHVKLSEHVTRTFKAGSFGCPLSRADVSFPSEKEPINTTLWIAVGALVISIGALIFSRT